MKYYRLDLFKEISMSRNLKLQTTLESSVSLSDGLFI